MVTTTTKPAARRPALDLTPIDAAPSVREAAATFAGASERSALLDARLSEIRGWLDPQSAAPPPTLDALLQARIDLHTLERDHAAAQIEEARARQAYEQAREAERAQRRALFTEERIRVVGELGMALETAATINSELRRVEAAQREHCGDWFLEPLAWAELDEPTATQPTRLGDWRRAVLDLFPAAAAAPETTTD